MPGPPRPARGPARRWRGAALLIAVLACGACGGGADPPPPPVVVVGVQPGVIREFRVDAGAGAGHATSWVWALNEADGARWSRTHLPTGPPDPPETTTHLYPSDGRRLLARQTLVRHAGERDEISAPAPEAVSLLDVVGLGIDFYTELARGPLARDVTGAPSGCVDRAVPLATVALSVLDPADAPDGTRAIAAPGSDASALIRLCGTERELRRVATPPFRVSSPGGPAVSSPAMEYRFTPLGRRRATPALIAETFDLARRYPAARVVRGPVAPSAGGATAP